MPAPANRPDIRPIGQAWLREKLGLDVPAPAVESYVWRGSRSSEARGPRAIEYYPQRQAVGEHPVAHLRFALRNEPLSLGVLIPALDAIGAEVLEGWVRTEPTGKFSRQAWFFYETFMNRRLDLPGATAGNYVPALDPTRHVTSSRRNSRRHRVVDNLLGDARLCPVVRRTRTLAQASWQELDARARALVARYDETAVRRAARFLYTKETRSSFAIENETPSYDRTQRFVRALSRAAHFDASDLGALVGLQNMIVEPRYAESSWRTRQNFIASTSASYQQEVHYVCPRPEDVPDLMEGWRTVHRRSFDETIDPVTAAAVTSFAFVLIHPFEDGNGRIHRFLLHNVLAQRSFGPPDVILPVSASILRNRRRYEEVLEHVSGPITERVPWHWTSAWDLEVEEETAGLYRYFDATEMVAYLFELLADALDRDLAEELAFLSVFDRAFEGAREIVDMPDQRLSLFVRLCLQNAGRLAKRKRDQFPELSDEEVERMERRVQEAQDALAP